MADRHPRKKRKAKVVRIYRGFQINSALIIFGAILIYVLVSVILALRKEPIATYRVNFSNLNNDIVCDGIALRQEKVVTSPKYGYVCYFVKDGERIARNANVCTVDETGDLIRAVSQVDSEQAKFSSAEYLDIRNTIDVYKTNYSDTIFSDIYNFRETIESRVLEMSSQLLMKEYSSNSAAAKTSVQNMKATDSGIITYYTDGYENLTPETLQPDDFNKEEYKATTMKSGDVVENGGTLYKIVPDEAWTICCYITVEQANLLQEEDGKLLFTLNNSDMELSAYYDLIRMGDGYVLVLPMEKYMIDYVNERFLSVEIILDKYEGLKVPNSALIDKTLYKIPKEYMTRGGDDTSLTKVFVQKMTEEGELTQEMRDPHNYLWNDTDHLVDADAFLDTDILTKPDSNETLPVTKLERVTVRGVYFCNQGLADFTPVTVVRTGDEFTIVEEKGDPPQYGEETYTKEGNLKEYDNIVMNVSQVTENQIIY
ncbi:MAG: hypothetical protein K5897_12130 [Eubacterium sp.]|nr:hypothetical protein [Eubacterium sp.]